MNIIEKRNMRPSSNSERVIHIHTGAINIRTVLRLHHAASPAPAAQRVGPRYCEEEEKVRLGRQKQHFKTGKKLFTVNTV